MKIIIAGGRDFDNYGLLHSRMNRYLQDTDLRKVVIVSGGAKGADELGELYADGKGLPMVRYRANWALHGKAAGPIRNKLMAERADALVAFWNGCSRGTGHMIDTMRKLGKPVRVVRYD